MFLIVRAEFIDVFIVHYSIKFYKPSSDKYWIIAMILKAKYKFCAATTLFQILQFNNFIISRGSQENANVVLYLYTMLRAVFPYT
jgi:hypothetical protein